MPANKETITVLIAREGLDKGKDKGKKNHVFD
jgi:hypothetical protein